MTVNTCRDVEGNERPIRYKAAELVNRPAPEGYHWQLRNEIDDSMEGRRWSMTYPAGKHSDYDYYVMAKDAEQA